MTEAKPVNQAIAELLGWTVKAVNRIAHSKTYLVSGEWFEYVEWQLIDPNEKQVGSLGYNSEAEAWAHVPDYENDLTAVVEVLTLEADKLQVVLRYNFYEFRPECEFVIQGLDLPADIRIPAFAYGETIAEAAAKCLLKYLQWKQSQGEK